MMQYLFLEIIDNKNTEYLTPMEMLWSLWRYIEFDTRQKVQKDKN